MKKYIELNESYMDQADDYDIKFFNDNEVKEMTSFAEKMHEQNDKYPILDINNFFDFAEKTNLDKDCIIEYCTDNYLDKTNASYTECKNEMIDYCSYDVTFDEFLNGMLDYFVSDIILIDYPAFCGYSTGTVGYSNWSRYITVPEVDSNFVRDVWEGYNFYDMAVYDENGTMIDSIGGCYIPSEKELIEYAKDYFHIEKEDIKLVDNDNVQYFDFKKYEMIPTKYKFKEVTKK